MCVSVSVFAAGPFWDGISSDRAAVSGLQTAGGATGWERSQSHTTGEMSGVHYFIYLQLIGLSHTSWVTYICVNGTLSHNLTLDVHVSKKLPVAVLHFKKFRFMCTRFYARLRSINQQFMPHYVTRRAFESLPNIFLLSVCLIVSLCFYSLSV